MKKTIRNSLSRALFYGGRCFGYSMHGTRILCYHRINNEDKSYISVSVPAFREQIKFLSDEGYQSIHLNDLGTQRESAKSIVITFDDGYRDNYENAFPILKEYGFTGTIFCIANKLDTEDYLTTAQIKELVSHGFCIGSHTLTHPELTKLERLAKWEEIAESKRIIALKTGKSCDFFCYPKGLFDAESVRMVDEAGYQGACSNRPGANFRNTSKDIYSLRRTEIAQKDTLDDFKHKVSGMYDLFHTALHWVRQRP